MSVANVMETMATQDASSSMGTDMTSGSQPAGSDNGKPVVGGVEDIMNLYSDYEDEDRASANGVKMKEDKNLVPDELNNVAPKELNSEDKKEVKAEAIPETSKDVINESSIAPDTVKVKINGIESEVPLKDVINSYSGQQEIQRRFTEFDKTKKAFELEKTQIVQMNDYVKQEIGDLRTNIESLMSQYGKNGYMDKNPLDVVNQLLDKMGINSNNFNKAVFEHQLPDYAKFFNMSEIERDALYAKKENEYLRGKEKGFIERDRQVKFREETQRKDFELIKNAGLDSVKYDELSSELRDAGHKDLTAEKVVEYAKQKPTLDKVVEVFKTIGADPLVDQRARTVFKILQDFPDTTVDEILDNMDPNRAAMKSAQILNAKASKVGKIPSNKGQDADMDEMLSYYKN